MPDIPLTLLLHFGLILAGVAGLRLFGRRTEPGALLLGLGIITVYWIVSPSGHWLQKQLPMTAGLRWNWLGKLLVIAAAAIYWRASRLTRAGIGLTWRQRPGSILPAAIGIALICAFAWTDEALLADGASLSTERLLFQGLMPGLDEEFVFRGLLLAFFAAAFGPGRRIAGGAFGVAGLAVTFLFAAGHGLFVIDDAVVANARVLFVTGTIGAGLVWLRTRTGSLIAPVLAHNLVNFGSSFF
ncbi:MAG: CPBP family intramembrane glutamic endopeptidase [Sphingomonas sp.]